MIHMLLLHARRFRRLLPLLLLGGTLTTSLPVLAWSQGDQKVTLYFKEAPLSLIFKGIEKQTGLVFMYNTNQVKDNYRVSIYVKKVSLEDVLKELLSPKGIAWEYRMKTVILKPEKLTSPISAVPADSAGNVITGEIRDPNGAPLQGAFIIVKSTQKGTVSNEKGKFSLRNVPVGAILQISYTGFTPRQVTASGNAPIQVKLDVANNRLDETVVMAYGTTSRRLNTGSISKVTGEEISRQPVSNPLAALEGKVPGALVTQSSGAPGASVKIQIRGQSSLANGSEPLYIIDGIPYAPNNNNVSSLGSILSLGDAGLSPFSMINPAEIESIEVLKDADATAIYGSRGANGVILITTRRPKAGKTSLSANFNMGGSITSQLPELLNTQQYLAMRREAFKNDGITPNATPGTPGYAPDLMIWDTTRYTNVPKLLYGGTANVLNAGLSVTGGNQQTQFLIGGNFHRETTVLPNNYSDYNSSFKLNLNHTSPNGRLSISLSSMANFDNNHLISGNVLTMMLPPNIPELYDSIGKLNWSKGGVTFQNPLADFNTSYSAITSNILNNLNIGFKILDGLTFRINGGFNIMHVDEKTKLPMSFFNPATNPTGSASFANSNFKSWIIEPQIEYTNSLLKGKMDFLLGATWQDNKKDNEAITLTGYSSDNLLGSIGAGPTVSTKSSDEVQYRYEALFARINYAYDNKYILNLTGRRDGSSRFAPDKRFSNFGAVGLAWLFSNERFFSHRVNFVSYGKVRGSYGITGNDQIPDYRYLSTWTTASVPAYQGGTAIRPENPFNPDFYWERNKKLEVALDLGLWHDRILLSAAYYQNRSNNQLVNYSLPSQTGFTSITKNLSALIVNKGWEFDVNIKAINNAKLRCNINGNLTFPTNKLVSFPGIENTPYFATYEIGKSISLIRKYKSLGVDPKTGLYLIEDLNHDGSYGAKDLQYIGKTDPDYFGSIGSEVFYRGFQLNFMFSFRKQFGKKIEYASYSNRYYPGLMFNQPTNVLDRWQQAGENTNYQKYTAVTSSDAYKQAGLFGASSGVYGDASFIRLRNISFSYLLPDKYSNNIGIKSGRIFVQAQNLFTITNYQGDPETQTIYGIPVLKTITGGIQITL